MTLQGDLRETLVFCLMLSCFIIIVMSIIVFLIDIVFDTIYDNYTIWQYSILFVTTAILIFLFYSNFINFRMNE